ncbi:hypothetical protein GCM10023205_21260 [Yinghuangia aomiensis]|uniref:DUF58 domain-containing protein n=1 Tax=Yinghuangia aomiensis TaxID=676205 RepID=A0ABP9H1A8_9ACTN
MARDPAGLRKRRGPVPARRLGADGWWLPTPVGTRVLAVSVLLLALSWPLGYPEAAVLGGGGLLAVLGGVAWVLPPLRVDAARTVAPARVTRGDRAEAVVTVTVRGRRGARRVDLEDACDGRPVAVSVADAAPHAAAVTRYPLPTGRRGRLAVGPLHAVRADPAGLARRARRCADDTAVLVRPRVHPLPLLASGRAHHIEGPNSASADGGSQTFHTLRAYVMGDDLRRIHWRSTARTGELMVRQMVDVSMPRTTVVLDTRGAAYPGLPERAADAFELAVEAAASVCCAALLHRFPLRLLTEGGIALADSARGSAGDELLDVLALVAVSEGTSVADVFDELDRSRADGTLVVVTGTGDTAGFGGLAKVSGRFERVLVVRVGGAAAAAADEPASVLPPGTPYVYAASAEVLVTVWQREAAR